MRVFQVASGNVGTEMVKRIQKHPDLELVGLHCYSPEKVGRDVGEIAGFGPLGVTATGTVDEILAARPDCLTFHGVWPDIELYERVLEAGINVVTTADWVTGHHRDTNHRRNGTPESDRLTVACERGKSTFYGTGMNPGLAQILTIVHSTDVADIEKVTCIESVDVSCHHSAETWENCGFGRPVDDPEVPRLLELGTRVFEDGVRLMADCLDIELDAVGFSYELGACTKDVDLGWYQLPAGSLGGLRVLLRRQGRRYPARRAAAGVADDPAHRPALEHPGMLHHQDRRRPVHLQQASDFAEARHRLLVGGGVRGDRYDRHRYACAECHSCGGRCGARHRHQRRPAAARVRRPIPR